MPPTFFVAALTILAGIVSPIVFLVAVGLAVAPRTRKVGLSVLGWGLVGMATALSLNIAVDTHFQDGLSLWGTVVGAGAGFTFLSVASAIIALWRQRRLRVAAG